MTQQINPSLQESQLKWWQGLDRYCWTVLIIAALGWLFDTMAQNIFNLIRVPSLKSVLSHQYTDPAQLDAAVKATGGIITSIFLLGWAVGGFVFGVIGDKIGRAKTMILTILIYAVFTALNGLTTHSWIWYAFMRFMTALGVGGEFAAGAALVAEVFPQRSRAMALGSLQALSAVGNMLACGITLSLGDLQAHWQWAFFICGAPALLVFWIMKSVKEPKKWQDAKASALVSKELGKIGDMFTNRLIRRNMIVALLMATAGVGGLWGVGFFSTDMLRTELVKNGWNEKSMGHAVSGMFWRFHRDLSLRHAGREGDAAGRLRPLVCPGMGIDPGLFLGPAGIGRPGGRPGVHPRPDSGLLHAGRVRRLQHLFPGTVPHARPRHGVRLWL
jgi:MFS family permease